MIIEYHVSGPLREIIEGRVQKVIHLAPGWVNRIVIEYTGEAHPEFEVSCFPNYEYRWLAIKIYPAFLENVYWEDSLIHELQHAIIRPYISKVETLLENFVPEEMRGYIITEIDKAEESVVQDLAIFCRKLVDNQELDEKVDEEDNGSIRY